MKLVDCVQYSPEWVAARLGKPTASSFKRIITEARMELSTSHLQLAYEKVSERLLGLPWDPEGKSAFMQRGNVIEPEARAWYEWKRELEVIPVGFAMRDDELSGCSPDALVPASSLTEGDGLLEIKCPSLPVHIGYLMSAEGIAGYKAQVQGQLWVCERQWCDTLSFCPGMPPKLVRQQRDEKFIAQLAKHVKTVTDYITELMEKFAAMGHHEKAYTPPDIWSQVPGGRPEEAEYAE